MIKWFFVLSVTFFIFSYFPANIPKTGSFSFISNTFLLVLASPSYFALCVWMGPRKATLIIVLLSLLSVAVEAFAISTGLPYGGFTYSTALGLRVFGLVPWSVAFAYLPILLGATTMASHLARAERRRFALLSALLVVSVDLVVDPAAVSMGLWMWPKGGAYFGVPPINFLGWAITGYLYSNIFYFAARESFLEGETVPLNVSSSLLFILSFWTGFLVWRGLTIPAAIGSVLLVAMFLLMRYRSRDLISKKG